jgi:hypothetical protein
MNKYFIIALYALLFTLSFQYFFGKESEKILANDIYLSIQDDTIVIPNAPKIEIINNST